MSRSKRNSDTPSEASSLLDAPLCVWLFVAGALVYAYWYFSAPMPWPAPAPGQPAFDPTRGDLVRNGLLLLPEIVMNWFGGGESPLGGFDRLGIVLMATLILLFSYALGEFVLFRLNLLKQFGQIDGFVLRLASGLMLLSWSTCVLGQFGLLHYPLAFFVVLATLFFALGIAWKKHVFERATEEQPPATDKSQDHESWAWLLAAAPLVLFTVGVSMLPPYEYDVVEYHLQLPKQWYEAGQITVLPGNIYSGMPMGAEMWALLPMVFQPWETDWYYGALAGKLIVGLFTLLTAGLLYGAGKRLSGEWAARASAISALGTAWLIYQSGTGLVDGVWAFYTLATLYPVLLVFAARPKDNNRLPLTGLAVFSGLMAGMAFSVKYPALLMAVLPVFGMWIYAVRTDWKRLGLYVAAVTVVVSPWLAKNVLATGNPVYPLAGNVFSTDIRSPSQIAQWDHAHQVPEDANGNRYSTKQLIQGFWIFLGRSDWMGLTIVPLAIAALWIAPRRLSIPLAVMLAISWLVWWGLSHRLERFLIPAIPLGCLLAGLGAQRISENRLGRVALRVWLGLGLFTAFALVNMYDSIKLDPQIFVSLESDKNVHITDAIAFLNEQASPEDVVLATGDAELFYLQPKVLYHTCFDDAPFKPLLAMTAQQRRDWLAERHVQWVYVHWGEIARFRSPGNYGFPEYVTREFFEEMETQGILERTQFVHGNPEEPAVVIYRVRPADAP